MRSQSTKAAAISLLLACSPLAQAAAHVRPYPQENAHLEARDPQFNFAGLFAGLSSLFGGITLPALPTATSTVSSKSVVVAPTTLKTSSLQISTSSAKAASSVASTAKVSSTVTTAVTSKSASASVATSVKQTSISAPGTSVKPTSSSTSSTAVKPASTSTLGTSVKPSSTSAPATSVKTVSTSTSTTSVKAPSISTLGTSVKAASSSASGTSIKAASTNASGTSIKASSTNASGTSVKAASTNAAGTSVKAASTSAPGSSVKSASTSVIASGTSVKSSVASIQSKSSSVVTSASSTSATSTVVAPPTSQSSSALAASSSSTSSTAAASASGSSCPIPRISRVSGSGAKSSPTAASSTTATTTSSSTGVTATSTSAAITSSAAVLSSSSSSALPSTAANLAGPSVTISNGVVVGSALPGGIEQYLGIPYAQPPVGQLRLKPPVAYSGSFGVLNATIPPPSCPQFAQALTGNYSAGGLQSLINEFVFTKTVEQEDCLTVSIYRPNNTTPGSKLPVVYWIYGGGFEFGATSMYNGSNFVARSVSLGAPVIFVEINYRVGGFGFLAGADLAAETSTNLGLRDQRLGLQWTADNIAAFGGDASKVTLWGESAGAISSCFHLVVNNGDNTYKGKPLFRGSIHNSGSFAPADNVTAPQAQAIYDQVVSQAGCTAATAAQRLSCLRSVDFATLHNATNSVPGFGGYRSADLSYLPRPDQGDSFFPLTAEIALASGLWTKTPFIVSNQEDEGSLLAIVQNNITNNDQLVDYVASWFPGNANAKADITQLAALYPDNATAGQPDGSPYYTGSDNNVYPQYKRLAAILGDIVFIITRRAFLNLGTGQGVKAWSYLSTYLRGFPTFGTLHGSDLGYLFDPLFANFNPTRSIQTYYISFINNLDPNTLSSPDTTTNWPLYNSTTPVLVEFTGGSPGYMNDTFRAPVYDFLLGHVLGLRV